jgi:hypothetical protein
MGILKSSLIIWRQLTWQKLLGTQHTIISADFFFSMNFVIFLCSLFIVVE